MLTEIIWILSVAEKMKAAGPSLHFFFPSLHLFLRLFFRPTNPVGLPDSGRPTGGTSETHGLLISVVAPLSTWNIFPQWRWFDLVKGCREPFTHFSPELT